MRLLAATILLLIVCSSVPAQQINSLSLRLKYGPPLDRETFTVRPEVEIRVDYGPSKQACAILLPSGMTAVGTPSPDVITRDQMKEILDDLVPVAVRGPEIKRGVIEVGILRTVYTEYEFVNILEHFKSGVGTGIVVVLKDPACQKQ